MLPRLLEIVLVFVAVTQARLVLTIELVRALSALIHNAVVGLLALHRLVACVGFLVT
ncbi:MAG: hypothetical protein RLY14_3022 [Planctomycetota bacterium]|jgi:hypothetical protein